MGRGRAFSILPNLAISVRKSVVGVARYCGPAFHVSVIKAEPHPFGIVARSGWCAHIAKKQRGSTSVAKIDSVKLD